MGKKSKSHDPIVAPISKPKKGKKAKKAEAEPLPEVDGVAIPESFVQHLNLPKQSKKSKKAAAAMVSAEEMDNEMDGAETGEAELPLMLTVTDERPPSGSVGLALATAADKADKAGNFADWLLAPLPSSEFLASSFGRRPVLISRQDRSYYDGWFSRAEIERQCAECGLRWTDDVDAARYRDGERTTHSGEGAATPAEVWSRYDEGCSIRLSWPHRHSEPLHAMLTQLEEIFGSGAGANAYATPPGSQGFAPHWDDIEAFVLQLEGEKNWRVYAPRSAEEDKPRFSSPNLQQDELGPLVGEATLRAGELLYLPRGFVHQAVCTESASLHVTVSVGRYRGRPLCT
jgi:lysine-specific demethylase/histidyl-hydroxylase NO66